MKRFFVLLSCFFSIIMAQGQYHAKQDFMLEPGAFFIAQKSWFFGTHASEKFSLAAGLNLGFRKGDHHGLQVSPMISMQQGIVIYPPCVPSPTPCPRDEYKIFYFKLPLYYRYTFFMNEAVIIKLFAGPQASIFIMPSKIKPVYQSATIDAAGGFEVCHYVSGNLYINYGVRVDYSLTKPVKYDVPDEYGGTALPSGSSNANMTAGLIIGADFLLERKFKKPKTVKPGAKAGG